MSPFALGELRAAAGERIDGWFEIASLPTGHRERLPLTIVHGRSVGPVLWVTANIHGDEVTGLRVIHELLDDDLSELRGTLVAIPSLNPAGLHTRQRRSYLDARDPNRLFPDFPPLSDESRPSLSVLEIGYARLLAAMRSADFLVDLHCYGLRASCFTIRDRLLYRDEIEREAALALDGRIDTLCRWLGLPVVLEVPVERFLAAQLHRSVSGAAVLQAKIPAVTVELGLTGGVDPVALAAGITALRNVLRGAGMLPGEPEPISMVPVPGPGFRVRRDLVPRARASGIVRYHVEPGDAVHLGDRIATMTDIHGRPLPGGGEILAEHEGWILALPRGVICFEGEAVAHMAIRDEGPLVERDPGRPEV